MLLVFNLFSFHLWEDSSSFFCISYFLIQYNSLLFPIKKNVVVINEISSKGTRKRKNKIAKTGESLVLTASKRFGYRRWKSGSRCHAMYLLKNRLLFHCSQNNMQNKRHWRNIKRIAFQWQGQWCNYPKIHLHPDSLRCDCRNSKWSALLSIENLHSCFLKRALFFRDILHTPKLPVLSGYWAPLLCVIILRILTAILKRKGESGSPNFRSLKALNDPLVHSVN